MTGTLAQPTFNRLGVFRLLSTKAAQCHEFHLCKDWDLVKRLEKLPVSKHTQYPSSCQAPTTLTHHCIPQQKSTPHFEHRTPKYTPASHTWCGPPRRRLESHSQHGTLRRGPTTQQLNMQPYISPREPRREGERRANRAPPTSWQHNRVNHQERGHNHNRGTLIVENTVIDRQIVGLISKWDVDTVTNLDTKRDCVNSTVHRNLAMKEMPSKLTLIKRTNC